MFSGKTERILETECDGLLSLKMIKNDFICFYALTECVGRYHLKTMIFTRTTYLLSHDVTIFQEHFNI
jgi:hypothetical protein